MNAYNEKGKGLFEQTGILQSEYSDFIYSILREVKGKRSFEIIRLLEDKAKSDPIFLRCLCLFTDNLVSLNEELSNALPELQSL